ncbi:hypothetical protein B0H16DRAFT_1449430 [Mycena metata]|uniref:Uncharacterized protein n=1 Tax=Mycena metata TaxID=1033252 RepID=A0AAD7NVZ9_9AGAR|nr:hypothetical protein B0H16DRAFT_1449430 [Mycena metata]
MSATIAAVVGVVDGDFNLLTDRPWKRPGDASVKGWVLWAEMKQEKKKKAEACAVWESMKEHGDSSPRRMGHLQVLKCPTEQRDQGNSRNSLPWQASSFKPDLAQLRWILAHSQVQVGLNLLFSFSFSMDRCRNSPPSPKLPGSLSDSAWILGGGFQRHRRSSLLPATRPKSPQPSHTLKHGPNTGAQETSTEAKGDAGCAPGVSADNKGIRLKDILPLVAVTKAQRFGECVARRRGESIGRLRGVSTRADTMITFIQTMSGGVSMMVTASTTSYAFLGAFSVNRAYLHDGNICTHSGTRTVKVTDDVGHTSLVAHDSSQVHRLLGVT